MTQKQMARVRGQGCLLFITGELEARTRPTAGDGLNKSSAHPYAGLSYGFKNCSLKMN